MDFLGPFESVLWRGRNLISKDRRVEHRGVRRRKGGELCWAVVVMGLRGEGGRGDAVCGYSCGVFHSVSAILEDLQRGNVDNVVV